MESSAIAWKIVSNTVADRMIDFSLIHKLTPSRRLWRRNKAMNAAIKQFHGIKTYSQYIKIKTSVLRNLLDNQETDGNSSLTEDDYNILYKSESSLTNYLMQAFKNNKDFSYETDIDTNEDDPQDERSVAQKLKRKSPKTIKLGWQKVMRRKRRNVYSAKVPNGSNDDSQSGADIRVEISNDKCPLISPESPIMNVENDATTQNGFKRDKFAEENLTMHDSLAVDVTQSDSTIKEECQEASSQEKIDAFKMTELEEDCAHPSNDIHEAKSISDASIRLNIPLGQDHISWPDGRPDRSTTLTKGTIDDKLWKIHPSIITSVHQQKDSGIEEDTEEELLQDGRRARKMSKNKFQQLEGNTLIDPPILMHQDDSKSLKHADVTDTVKHLDQDREKVMECEGNAKKHKLQPTVTCTEIVSKKYKIVSCNEPILDKHAELQEFCDREINNEEECGPNVEENIPSLTEKRVQQLRRLNLTADSDSSLSENEDTCNNVKDLQSSNRESNNVYKRKAWSDCIDEKRQDGCNIKMKDNIEENQSRLIEKDNTKVQNEKLRKRHTSFLGNEDRSLKQSSKNNELSKGNKTVRCKPNLEDELNRNNSYEENDTGRLHGEGAESESIMHRTNKNAVMCNRRPCNLQELIEEEEKAGGRLIPETALPTFAFKEIEEDELFIVDVPTVVLNSQLIGKRIVLTERKLKLGKEKYKVEYKDIENVSCVFATGKSRKPYKTVKIEPVARIVTRQKVASKSVAQMSN